ncbi:COQ9 family protein [Sandaracinobacteroides saxicola]|uniref:COQ9 family protein n=1 Tax=Sandaracinobacteroides saxicola TaxID=2759707 RepID=A0A7G5IJU6_9SPHN|nr:COQ9 family protein [Sandaracinobacteroides saxicola]QMW23638.1 COQ9 family protein [Sandaracinobacteroides saxicola]
MEDLTLDELRPRLATALLAHVPFDGWSRAALANTASDIGVDPDVAALAFPNGAPDMIAAYIGTADQAMLAACATPDFAALKIRERITRAIRVRFEAAEPHQEAIRRASAILALPGNAALSARLLWSTADAIWRAAGDTSTDFNHYSKRALASAVYASTLLYWLQDDSEGRSATWAFLDRRIAGVMRIEKLKARFKGAEGFSPLRFLGRLRYPAG